MSHHLSDLQRAPLSHHGCQAVREVPGVGVQRVQPRAHVGRHPFPGHDLHAARIHLGRLFQDRQPRGGVREAIQQHFGRFLG